MNRNTLSTIAKQHLDVATLDANDSEFAEFRVVSVGNIESALTAAYLAGYAAATRAAAGSVADALPTERHVILGKVWLGEGEAADLSDDPRAETILTAPIPEVALTARPWQEAKACDVLIPTAIRQRRLS